VLGETVTHYRILEELGRGGMGVVYLAEDIRLGRRVALKFLPPDASRDAEVTQRFIQEARTASALDHPNVCTIYEIRESQDSRLFIAMACYDGETLEQRLRRGRLSVAEAIDVALQMARGLRKAHEAGIVHRDIKPANVFLTRDGIVKILDFGIAKLGGAQALTRTGMTLGTGAYMSPEQIRGEEADARTDLWSLGIVLYEMLSGERPFGGERELVTMYAAVNEPPRPLHATAPDVPLEEILVARDLEPESPIINSEVGLFYLMDRQYERALEELLAASVLDPTYPSTVWNMIRAFAFLGRLEEGRAAARRLLATVTDPVPMLYGGAILPSVGLVDEARKIYTRALEMSASTYVMPGLLGLMAATIGEHDAAFEHFERALEERSLVVSWLRDPLVDDIRDDPRYTAIFIRVGLPP
jgi:serine/threonine protein kinase